MFYTISEITCLIVLLFAKSSSSCMLLGNPSRTPISLHSKKDIAVAILDVFSREKLLRQEIRIPVRNASPAPVVSSTLPALYTPLFIIVFPSDTNFILFKITNGQSSSQIQNDLKQKGLLIKDRGKILEILSSGVSNKQELSKDTLISLKGFVDRIVFSIYGGEDVHNKVCGWDSYKILTKSVESVIEQKIPFLFQTVAMKMNKKDTNVKPIHKKMNENKTHSLVTSICTPKMIST